MPRLLLALLTLAACNEVNKQFCDNPDHASDPRCMNTVTCMGPDMCPMSMPVCDLTDNGGTCVACTASEPGVCGGATPICSTDHKCVACSTDTQCNGVCLPSGACAAATDIIYVKPSGNDSPTCMGTATDACSLNRGLLIAASAPTRNVLLLASGTYPNATVGSGWLVAGTVTIDARDNVDIEHVTSNGNVITVAASAHLTLLGGRIHDGIAADGIQALGGSVVTIVDTTFDQNGLQAIECMGCTLDVNHATLTNNGAIQHAAIVGDSSSTMKVARSAFTMNRGGAIDTAGKFVIVNNFIYNNGDQNGLVGGIRISTVPATGNQLDFNSVIRNLAQSGPGVNCNAGGGFTAKNNIIWNNNLGGVIGVAGSCLHAFSLVGPMTIVGMAMWDGGNNMPDDPKVMDELGNLHLGGSSPAKDKADPGATMAVDFDGQPRPQPTGQHADIGADEIP